jgi:hypothetical protein
MRFRQFFGLKPPVSRKQSFASSHLSHVAHPAFPATLFWWRGQYDRRRTARSRAPSSGRLDAPTMCVVRRMPCRHRPAIRGVPTATARSAPRLDKNGRWRADLSERMFSSFHPCPIMWPSRLENVSETLPPRGIHAISEQEAPNRRWRRSPLSSCCPSAHRLVGCAHPAAKYLLPPHSPAAIARSVCQPCSWRCTEDGVNSFLVFQHPCNCTTLGRVIGREARHRLREGVGLLRAGPGTAQRRVEIARLLLVVDKIP